MAGSPEYEAALVFCKNSAPEDIARELALLWHSKERLEKESANFHRVMLYLRAQNMEHGLCQPRERRACTRCNAKDDLEQMLADYKGPRIIPAAAGGPGLRMAVQKEGGK